MKNWFLFKNSAINLDTVMFIDLQDNSLLFYFTSNPSVSAKKVVFNSPEDCQKTYDDILKYLKSN